MGASVELGLLNNDNKIYCLPYYHYSIDRGWGLSSVMVLDINRTGEMPPACNTVWPTRTRPRASMTYSIGPRNRASFTGRCARRRSRAWIPSFFFPLKKKKTKQSC